MYRYRPQAPYHGRAWANAEASWEWLVGTICIHCKRSERLRATIDRIVVDRMVS